jgi:energy-coupling factor transport system ATP-binding protein
MNINVTDLHFSYPSGTAALRGISLNIEAGEQVAIVGQNGAGKTTLVKHFNGLLQPGRGEVRVGDLSTRGVAVSKLAARVGYVFQNPDEQLFCKTVGEEVAFGPRNLKFSPEKIADLTAQALELTELSDRANTNPYDLTPTWRKMVALASIVAMDTAIVIFDEPTTGQDTLNIERIARVIATLRAQGKTVITITHDIDFCAENFNRVIVLAQGQILLDGPAATVLGQEEILARTYVEPPQLTRLGKRLGLNETILDEAGFLKAYRNQHLNTTSSS